MFGFWTWDKSNFYRKGMPVPNIHFTPSSLILLDYKFNYFNFERNLVLLAF